MPIINLLPGGAYTSTVTNQVSDLANTYYVNPSGSADDSASLNSLLTSSGKHLILGGGTFRLRATIQVLVDGTTIEGSGRGATILQIDDSLGNIGDGILIKNTNACEVKNLKITAASQRTAGNGIHVTGGASTATLDAANPNLRDSSTKITDVDMTSQFTGILVDSDEVNNYQNWRTYIRGGIHRSPSTSGQGIWINTAVASGHYGASHFIEDYYFATGPASTTPTAGIRLSGTGDVTLANNEVYGSNYPLLIDPPANGFVTCVNVLGGFYDTATLACLRIAPNATASLAVIKAVGVWFGTSAADAAQIVGAQAKGIHFVDCTFANAQAGWACIVDTATNVDFTGCHFSSASAGGLKFTNNAAQFIVTGCKFLKQEHPGASNSLPIGVQIDAGSDHYYVSGNVFDAAIATKITNTPGDSAGARIATGASAFNITA